MRLKVFFLSNISPERICNRLSIKDCSNLSNSIKAVLNEAINMGGTTLKDFYSADGNQGYFKSNLMFIVEMVSLAIVAII